MTTDGSCWQPTCLTFLVCQQWPCPMVCLYGFRLWSVFPKVWEERRFPPKKSACFVGTCVFNREWLKVSNHSHSPHVIKEKKQISHIMNGARKKKTHTLYSHKCKFTPKWIYSDRIMALSKKKKNLKHSRKNCRLHLRMNLWENN